MYAPRRSRLLPFGVLCLAASAAQAQTPPSLSLPLECEIGKVCVVQNYVDRDPGPAARDYRCGRLTYDGHKGTDIRVIVEEAWQAGIAVVAAAPGRVRAVRDGMADVSVREIGKDALEGREAGNSVVIVHGDGWETQYAHLRRGSVAVRPGDEVERGRKLGVVGLSGNTEFPHVHFEVRQRTAIVDPFVGVNGAEDCQPGREPLWRQDALAALAYVETGVLDAGISGAAPALAAGRVDRKLTRDFDAASDRVIFWAQIYGARKGDLEEFRLLAPDGSLVARRRALIARDYAQWLAYAGRRRPEVGWARGVYRGEYTLYRGPEKQQVLSLVREVALTAEPTGSETAPAARK